MDLLARKPVILVPIKHYEPAFRFGGPVRSIANLVAAVGHLFEFKIICSAHDFRDTTPLKGITEGKWTERGSALVYYLRLTKPLSQLYRLMRDTEYDVLYLNSFFEPIFSTWPAFLTKCGATRRRPIVVAPRGEFSPSALGLSPVRKRLFATAQRWTRLYRDATWQATTSMEAAYICSATGNHSVVRVAPNLGPAIPRKAIVRPPKKAGALRITYLSRISPMKNLLGLIASVAALEGTIKLDIWGPIDDALYWRTSENKLRTLPDNISASYCGALPHDKVLELFSQSEVFALPTFGENYGHVIQEALAAGCPVVISDRTPWRNLGQHGVGFDVALDSPTGFAEALQKFVEMTDNEYSLFAGRCKDFARRSASNKSDVQANIDMFMHALSKGL